MMLEFVNDIRRNVVNDVRKRGLVATVATAVFIPTFTFYLMTQNQYAVYPAAISAGVGILAYTFKV